jgi:RND family efflux transporter MFP subunit
MRQILKTPFVRRATTTLAAIGLLATTANAVQQQEAPPALVEIAEASSEMMAPLVFMPGTIVSRNDSQISAEITGRVIWVASEGTLVHEGDVIATIDDQMIALSVERNQSQIKRLEARIKYLNADIERTRELAATNNVAARRLEEEESTLVMTEQDLAQAKIALKQAEISLERTKVRAPFPGRVVARLAQTGEYATPGKQIVRLVDTQHLEVSAQAPVALAGVLKDDQQVSLRQGQTIAAASIRALVPVGDAVSRTMEIRVALPTEQSYVVGAAVQVGLPSSAPEQVVAVPRDALVLRREGTYVFRINEENKAERMLVRTGAATGKVVAVSGGIRDGDRVVTRGGERLRPGQAVELAQATSGR